MADRKDLHAVKAPKIPRGIQTPNPTQQEKRGVVGRPATGRQYPVVEEIYTARPKHPKGF